MKVLFLPFAAVAASALSACNGSSSSSPFFNPSSSYVRIAHGSPDAGTVNVEIDGATVSSGLAYGAMSSYASVKVGSHTLDVYVTGNTSKPLVATSFSTNGGQDTTVVLTGERHPSYASKRTLGLRVFYEEPYDTPSGGAALNFHNAAPIAPDGLRMNAVQFGYSLTSTPGNDALGAPQSYGGDTTPIGLPTAALNVPITLYGKNYKSYTITPGDAMTGCTGMPCNGQQNLSLYFIDGPGASHSPTSGYPSYFPPDSKADFIGTFDGNGLIQ
jgi:hypothetical protein